MGLARLGKVPGPFSSVYMVSGRFWEVLGVFLEGFKKVLEGFRKVSGSFYMFSAVFLGLEGFRGV